jgi:carbamate kinase
VDRAWSTSSREHEVIDVDGARVLFGDGWGLIRASNTEPVLVARYEARTPERLAEIRDGWNIAIVHGNGPRWRTRWCATSWPATSVPPLPLGVLVAGTEGWIGYMIQQSLQNALLAAAVERQVVTLVTQVLVDPDDPELREPSKPIGRTMDEATARALAAELGWTDRSRPRAAGAASSPRPGRCASWRARMIRTLVHEGHLVIAAGGGGTPVYLDPSYGLEGVDAVVDKDRAAARCSDATSAPRCC